MNTPARSKIIARLYEVGRPVAVHDLKITGVSDNAAATRLSEMAREGIVEGIVMPGTRYKCWRLKSQELTLPISA